MDHFELINAEALSKSPFRRHVYCLAGSVLVLALLSIALVVALADSLHRNDSEPPRSPRTSAREHETCRSAACLTVSTLVTLYLNRSTDPCQDFYQFACGKYKYVANIPEGSPMSSRRNDFSAKDVIKHEDLLMYPVKDNREDSAERKVKDFFVLCESEFWRSHDGAGALWEAMENLLGPNFLLHSDWHSNRTQLTQLLIHAHRSFRLPAFFRFTLGSDWKDSKKYMLTIVPGDVSQATAGHHEFEDPLDIKTVKVSYEKYIRQIAGFFIRDSRLKIDNGTAHDRVEQFVKDVIKQELEVLQILREHGNFNNGNEEPETEIKKLKDFAKEFKAIDWMKIVPAIVSEVALTGERYVRVGGFGALRKFDELVRREGQEADRIMGNYITWGILQSYLEYLPWEYRMARYDMQYESLGAPLHPTPAEACLRLTKYHLGYAFLAEFAKTHVGSDTIGRIEDVFNSLRSSWSERLQLVSWMDDQTRLAARQKLAAMTEILAFPKLLRDGRAVDSMYRNLDVNPANSFLWNLLSTNKFMWQLMAAQLQGEYQLGLWQQVVMSEHLGTWVNYYRHQNALLVPPGILQLPFFSPIFPDALVFGSIGAEMARYMGRGIDAEGSGFFNETTVGAGSWYTEAASEGFERQKKCLAEFFAQRPMRVEYTGQRREIHFRNAGQSAPIRNAAERISGVRAGYHAYRSRTAAAAVAAAAAGVAGVVGDPERAEHAQRELRLPALGLTPEQVYFVSSVQANCEVWRPDLLYQLNQHSRFKVPSMKYILNGVMSNTPEFAEAFQCPPDSPMKVKLPCLFL